MSGFARNPAALSFSLLSLFLASCGSKSSTDAELNTIVGRGGAFFDRRVQVINALPNLANGTACVYVSEFDKSKAPLFSGESALSKDQRDFLLKAERDARPLTLYPVSIADLDRGLAQKDVVRGLRGLLLIPTGIVTAYHGLVALGFSASEFGLGAFFSNPMTYPFLFGMLGGFGLLNQATRDLNPKNYGLRLSNATVNSSAAPSRSNLGVTIAFQNVAKSLPAASNQACPANLTAEAVQPFFQTVMNDYRSLSDSDLSKIRSDALAQLKNTDGCHFLADLGEDKLVYQATPSASDASTVRLQTFKLNAALGAQLLADEELKLQLKSDTGAGRKYISDNERGSIAIWLSQESNGKVVAAKLAHKLPSGAYVGNQTQLSGTCKL